MAPTYDDAAYGNMGANDNEIENGSYNIFNIAMSTEIRTVLAFTGLTVGAVALYGGKNFSFQTRMKENHSKKSDAFFYLISFF